MNEKDIYFLVQAFKNGGKEAANGLFRKIAAERKLTEAETDTIKRKFKEALQEEGIWPGYTTQASRARKYRGLSGSGKQLPPARQDDNEGVSLAQAAEGHLPK